MQGPGLAAVEEETGPHALASRLGVAGEAVSWLGLRAQLGLARAGPLKNDAFGRSSKTLFLSAHGLCTWAI